MQSLPNSDYNHLTTLLKSEELLNLNLWNKVDNFDELQKVKKRKCSFAGKGGIYALIDKEGFVAYIGKAKCLHNRLSSHSKALVGGDEFKAPSWHEFFSSFGEGDLTAKYLLVDGFSTDINAELGRRAIESALQMIYRPYFDLIYSVRSGNTTSFNERLLHAKRELKIVVDE